MKFTILLGTFHFHRLCTRRDGTTFRKAPSMSRKSTEVTSPTLQDALILCIRRCMASVVVRPGLPPKWLSSSSCYFSVTYVSCSAIIAISTFHIVFRSAMGLYAFGTLYCGFPGFLSTTVVNRFHGLYNRFLSNMALYMWSSLSVSRCVHLVSMMFGILSGPGALYGFSLCSCFCICSMVISFS